MTGESKQNLNLAFELYKENNKDTELKLKDLQYFEETFFNNLYIQLKAGARQLKQVAKHFKIDLTNPEKMSTDQLVILLAGYNAGQGRVERKGIGYILEHYEETKNYIVKLIPFFKEIEITV